MPTNPNIDVKRYEMVISTTGDAPCIDLCESEPDGLTFVRELAVDEVFVLATDYDTMKTWLERLRESWRVLSQGGCIKAYHPQEYDAVKKLDSFLYLDTALTEKAQPEGS